MKPSKLVIGLVLVAVCTGVQMRSPVPAFARSDSGVISGELVKLDGTVNQFRIVDHGGPYTAPAGVSLEALDGKAVYVELAGGRVVQISEKPIPIDPIDHGFETLSGELVVRDAVTGSFMLAGDDRIYTAPPSIDIRQYAGRKVEIRLDESGRLVDIHFKSAALDSPIEPVARVCSYNGQAYSEGISVCQGTTQYRCGAGTWHTIGVCSPTSPVACSAAGVPYGEGTTRCDQGSQYLCERGKWRSTGIVCPVPAAASAERAPSTCVVGGATVADGSSICREGTAYRCSFGQWVNLGTTCS